nr:transporter substrate-binding domain-containing protein [Duganella flavida]
MPVHAPNATEGVQVALVKAIARVSGTEISYDVFPFSRSISNVVSGKEDMHIPLIESKATPESRLKFVYSKETIFRVNFVLYTRKGSGVTASNLTHFTIATDRAHVNFFPFPILDSGSISSSLKMLSMGRIDGYIFADTSTDPVLQSLRLSNIQRSLYQRFDVKIISPPHGTRASDFRDGVQGTGKAKG